MLGIGIGVNRLTGLLGEILPELTISTQPTLAGFPTTIDAGTTWASLAATLTQKGQATDGASTVAGVPSFIGISDPSVGGEVATAVRFTFSLAGSQTSLVTLALDPTITVPVPVPAPVITGLPTISGVERVGELLTATPASVTNGGTLTWQWFAGGVAISGATSNTFLLTLAQEGTAISVQQTQTNATGADAATSAATGAIVHVAPTASNALAEQSFTIGTGVQTYAAAGDFTGEELSFSLNTITGVTINAATGVVSFDTDTMALQASTSIVVTASNSGGSVNSGFGVSITAVAFAFTDNGDGTLDVTTEGTQPAPIIVNNGDGTATTDEAGAYIYKPSANAEDDFTGAVGSSTLATATGAGTFKVYKRVSTGNVITSPPAFPPELAAIGARLWGWYDMVDQSNTYQDTGYSNPVTAGGQTILSITDKGGNGAGNARNLQVLGGATWNAGGFVRTDASTIAFRIDTNPELNNGMEIYVGIKTDAADGRLLSKDSGLYVGFWQSPDVGTGAGAVGAYQHTVGSPPVDVNPQTRQDLKAAFSDPVGSLVAGAYALDMTTATLNGVDPVYFLGRGDGSYSPIADISDIIITDTLTPTERANIVAYMNGRLP